MKTRALALIVAFATSATAVQAMSNMQKTVLNDLRKSGVSEECLQKVTSNDAARLTSWRNDPDMSSGSKNRMSKDFVRKICAR